jgi:hypothetical protein
MQLLARADRGQLFENLLVMRVAVCPESFAGIAKGVPPKLVAKIVRVAKVVKIIAAAFASRQKMVYRALQVWMVGEGQSTDPALWVNGFEYFLLQATGKLFISSSDVWIFQPFCCFHPLCCSSRSSRSSLLDRFQVSPLRRQFFLPLNL